MPLSDVFIATEAEAKSLGPDDQPLQKFVGEDVKGVDVVKLEQLLSIIQTRAFDAALTDFPIVAEPSEEVSLVFRISPALTRFFAELDEKQITTWGERWSKIEEFRLDRFEVSDVINVTRVFCRLARQATASSKSLFLWMAV